MSSSEASPSGLKSSDPLAAARNARWGRCRAGTTSGREDRVRIWTRTALHLATSRRAQRAAVAPRDRLGEGDHFPGRRSVTRAKRARRAGGEGAHLRTRDAAGAVAGAKCEGRADRSHGGCADAGGGHRRVSRRRRRSGTAESPKTRVAFGPAKGSPWSRDVRADRRRSGEPRGTLRDAFEGEEGSRALACASRATRAIVCARASGFQRFRDGFARVTKHTPTDFRQSHPQPRKAKSKISRPSDSAGDRHPNKEEWESFGLPCDFRRENRPTRNRHFDSSFRGSRPARLR